MAFCMLDRDVNNVTTGRTDGVRHVGKKPSLQRLSFQSCLQQCVSNCSLSQYFGKLISEVPTWEQQCISRDEEEVKGVHPYDWETSRETPLLQFKNLSFLILSFQFSSSFFLYMSLYIFLSDRLSFKFLSTLALAPSNCILLLSTKGLWRRNFHFGEK